MTETTRTRSRNSSHSTTSSVWIDSMTDVKDTEFTRKMNSGQLVCHPMDKTAYKAGPNPKCGFKVKITPHRIPPYVVSYANVVQTPKHQLVPSTAYASWPSMVVSTGKSRISAGGLDAWPGSFSVEHTKLSSNLAEGIASTLVSVAEAHKTIRMIAKAIRYLRRPIRDAAKELHISRRVLGGNNARSRRARKRVMDRASNAWLEGRYGWRPFIYDVMDHVEAANTIVNVRRTVRDFGLLDEKQVVTRTPIQYSTTSGPLQRDLVRTTIYQRIWRIGQTCDYRSGLDLTARKYGLYDIAGAAWDLVPLSFVYDWFINLGDALRSLEAYALIDERVGWTVTEDLLRYHTHIEDVDLVPKLTSFATVSVEELYGNDFDELFSVKQRIKVASFLPALGLRYQLDLPKIADLAALFRQFLRSR